MSSWVPHSVIEIGGMRSTIRREAQVTEDPETGVDDFVVGDA